MKENSALPFLFLHNPCLEQSFPKKQQGNALKMALNYYVSNLIQAFPQLHSNPLWLPHNYKSVIKAE